MIECRNCGLNWKEEIILDLNVPVCLKCRYMFSQEQIDQAESYLEIKQLWKTLGKDRGVSV